MNFFIDGAKTLGAEVEQKDGYTYVTGNFVFSSRLGGFKYYMQEITYIVGIESDEEENLYSLASKEEGAQLSMYDGPSEDGHAFEAELAKNKERIAAEERADQAKADRIVNNFKTQLDSAGDLKSILKVLIKFSKQKIDRDLILDAVVARIEGKDTAATDNWYDELSDINN
jgi:hypothetical protein